MRKKFNVFLTLLLALAVQITFAQEKSISGVVTDASDGSPMPGVNVIVKGTTTGDATDFDGKYHIKAKAGDVLVFSYVGFSDVTKTVGASSVINVVMKEDSNVLETTVITAQGVKREKKSLGYATQKVKNEAVTKVKDANFMNSLSGKIAGLDIKKSNNMGGSTNIIIRGYSSLTGNNQPLFVIDGVPISNDNVNSSTQKTNRGGYDYGNAASDIDPDTIESINVLKGGAATALYGSRAANGVIMITTKKGKKSKKLGLTVNSSVNFSRYDPDTFVKYQTEYGGGYGPFYGAGRLDAYDVDGDGNLDYMTPLTEDASYGAKFDETLMVYQWDAMYPGLDNYKTATPWVAAKHLPGDMFETGMTLYNNFQFDGGTDKSTYLLSYSNMKQTGIMPNSEIGRNNLDLRATFDFNKKLTAGAKFSYIKTTGKGRYGTGYDADNLMTSFRQWYQVNVDILEQKDAYFKSVNEGTPKNYTWNPHSPTQTKPEYWDNPYWTRYENYQDDERNRMIGYASLSYKINDIFSLAGRMSFDHYTFGKNERNNVGSVDISRYSRYDRKFTETNNDVMLNFKKNFSKKFNVRGIVGMNFMRSYTYILSASTNGGLTIPGLYTLSNSKNDPLAPGEYEAKQGRDGYYVNTSFGYDNFLFFEGSYRMDHASTLPEDVSWYDYYGFSGSYIFSKHLKFDALSFGKFRVGYAKTGNPPPAFRVKNTYNLGTPFNGQVTASTPYSSNNPDLKPESSYEKEIGLEMRFLKSRVGFDLSLYDKTSEDLLMPISISTATGYGGKWVNAGSVQNKGVEAHVFGRIFDKKDFKWQVDVNWSQNKNEVLSLKEGMKNLELTTMQGGVSINATVGQPYGTIIGTDHVYLDGKPVVKANGYYEKGDKTVIGNFQPDWKGGINNKFSYKNISFSFLIDMQKGGQIFSLDTWYGYGTGLYDITAGNNDLGNPVRDLVSDGGGVILDGVQADGSTNEVRAYAGWFANPWGWYRAVNKQHVYDASYIKLREIAFSYKVNKKLLEKTFIKGLTFTLTGKNLWIISKNIPYSDPEAGISSGNIQGYQGGVYPSTRDYGFSIKLEI
jgi:TonB-linked SusC/RagA family outer membrane protein